VVVENQEPEALAFSQEVLLRIQSRFDKLVEQGVRGLISQGFDVDRIEHELFLNMRYQGSDTALMIRSDGDIKAFAASFTVRHQQEFGFTQPRDILVEDVRVRSVGRGAEVTLSDPFTELRRTESSSPVTPVPHESLRKVYFEGEGWTETELYFLGDLPVGARVQGPAIIVDDTQTVIVDPASAATILPEHLILEILDVEKEEVGLKVVDPVQLSIFGHRFMSIAEQMGQTMQKTSISVNIKERLDFSCAVFSTDGGLVANAPHIPGHLGSMSHAIAYQARLYGPGELKPGDVLLSNHPCSGGTHLSDLTVTTPVFDDEDPTKILFFVANRGHHADIGGIQPGSMPPNSTELWQEGVAVESFKMVKEGVFDHEGLTHILYDVPASYPGCSGTRTLRDNIADLKAAVAANNRGIQLLSTLIKEYTWPVVQFYMEAIQNNAAQSVRTLLKQFSQRFDGQDLQATEYLDDGTPLCLAISISGETGDAVFDFTGTGPEHFGNLNCPPAVMYSGIMVSATPLPYLTICQIADIHTVLPPLHDLHRHPPKPRLPRPHKNPLPPKHHPLPLPQSRHRRLQRRNLATNRRPHPESLPSLRLLPRDLQQPNLRLWRLRPRDRQSSERLRLLRDDRRRLWRGRRLGRQERRAHARDQHADLRPGDFRAALSSHLARVLHPARKWRRRSKSRRRWVHQRYRVQDASASVDSLGASRDSALRHGWGRRGQKRRQFVDPEGSRGRVCEDDQLGRNSYYANERWRQDHCANAWWRRIWATT
jgi:hypothetical protein